jgi:D-alanyl-D-alanine carboxypeptidase
VLRRNVAALKDGIRRVPTSFRCHWYLFPAFALALATATPAAAAKGPFILVDAESGKVIAQHEAGRQWYPASITKLMTVYVTFRAIRAGRVAFDTPLTVSANALAQPPSKMGFPVGIQITIDNALKILMVKSANDIAVVLAEGVGGSVPAFVAEMNKMADELGMNGTQYRNPHGLPDDEQVTTARDMALLARALMREFPEHELLFRIPALRVGKRILRNHNRLIDRYPGADGMKTGFICSGGYNVVATAKRGNKHLIAVVLGAHSSSERTEDAARLFEAGFGGSLSLASLFTAKPTLDKVENVAVGPLDLRDEICSRKKRRRQAAEADDDEDPEATDPESGLAVIRAGSKQSFLIDLPPSMPPIRVFVGPASKPNFEPVLPVASRKAKRTKSKAKTKAKSDTKAKPAAKEKAAPKAQAETKAKDAPKAASKQKSKK